MSIPRSSIVFSGGFVVLAGGLSGRTCPLQLRWQLRVMTCSSCCGCCGSTQKPSSALRGRWEFHVQPENSLHHSSALQCLKLCWLCLGWSRDKSVAQQRGLAPSDRDQVAGMVAVPCAGRCSGASTGQPSWIADVRDNSSQAVRAVLDADDSRRRSQNCCSSSDVPSCATGELICLLKCMLLDCKRLVTLCFCLCLL